MRKSPSELYHRLTSRQHGMAQFTPEPNENLDIEYQKIGVSIGDVGIWHEGSFEVLFNACWPATHSINGVHGVPADFAPFLLHNHDISRRAYHSPGSIIANGKVSELTFDLGASSVVTPLFPTTLGSSFTIKFHSKEAAVLVLPEGASRQNLLPVENFRAHARRYSPQWYKFARDCLPSTGSLFVVTGCDKTTSWGIATASTMSGSVGFSLKFTVVGFAETTLAPKYQWKDFGAATIRTSGENPLSTENQCIFVRGFFCAEKDTCSYIHCEQNSCPGSGFSAAETRWSRSAGTLD
ncbi:Cell division control protein [Mycena venus]|uniref:Cell division control protein n=1 Tax=Mycena venus TaxID=2733690 RepID=A0A8H6XA06_9AGAR|nr:Cell division control protein [Mycena venus]